MSVTRIRVGHGVHLELKKAPGGWQTVAGGRKVFFCYHPTRKCWEGVSGQEIVSTGAPTLTKAVAKLSAWEGLS